MEQRTVRAGLDIVDDTRFEVDVDGPRNVLARAGLGEERGETDVVLGRRGIGQTTFRLNARHQPPTRPRTTMTYAKTVFKEVKLPCDE